MENHISQMARRQLGGTGVAAVGIVVIS